MGKQHSNEDVQRLKMLSYQVKATTYLKGNVKNDFMGDCILRGITEANLLREIVMLHYDIMKKYAVEKKEFSDIKKLLL